MKPNHLMVLDVLKKNSKALTAYDVLADLRHLHPKIAPTTVYRALTALEEQGRVHRIESKSAYIACRCDQHGRASVLSVCEDCGRVEECVDPELLDAISTATSKTGFKPLRHVIEVHGLCAICENGAATS
ncbi:MAG: Fur family transcriptional regulator [Pseudomonadota bacterium]